MGGVIALSAIAAIWLGAKAHRQRRWDEAAALELALDTARDWLRSVHGHDPGPADAQDVLYNRVIPRLASWDVPPLVALLQRIADQMEDRARGRETFDKQQLNELFAHAAQLLSKVPAEGFPAIPQTPGPAPRAIEAPPGNAQPDIPSASLTR